MGRSLTPTQVKDLRSTSRKDRAVSGIVAATVKSVTKKHLTYCNTDRSRKIFKLKAGQLITLGILTENDIEALAMYSNSLDVVLECFEEMSQWKFKWVTNQVTGENQLVKNPYMSIYKTYVEIVNKLGSDFGFSPVSRMRIATQPNDDDDLSRLMKQFN